MFNRILMRNLEDFENPRIVKLTDDLYGASFFLMKLLPARYMLERASEQGLLSPGATICESSSGTFGLALAMLAVQYGYKLILVSDWALDRHLHKRLLELGAQVEIVDRPARVGGLQQARLNRLAKYLQEVPGSYWPSQYSNTDNPLSYGKFAELLIRRVGKIDCLVGPVGSGGSMCGTTTFLRTLFPELHAVGVDTPNSVLFGQHSGKPIPLSGLGGAFVPSNVDHTQFDEVHWLTPVEVFHSTHRLHRHHGLFMGPTSGAAYRVANWWSRKNGGKKVVAIFPDEGHRYVETVYDENWLSSVPGWPASVSRDPVIVEAPTQEMTVWSTYAWRRRTLDQVLSSLIEQPPMILHASPQQLADPGSPERNLNAQNKSTTVIDETRPTRLIFLTRFDSGSVAHLRLKPEQTQFVDPLYAVFRDLQDSSLHEDEHPCSLAVGDKIVGFFVLRERAALPEWALLDAITVHSFRIGQPYQGNGYGKAASGLMANWVLSNRQYANRLMLAVNRRNALARRTYLNSGFRETGVNYCGPTGHQDIFEYKLRELR
ncbi:pyridoxal-phosphate dependent enzyme [Paraburkholderia dipogonis]|uniref:Pyridoxal-phosphate dependent enzyme n=1 Tax=Paraburkholderia dipogonis TaxID=1211383 RepID=A0A4Y8MGI1_9BURK|nr:pyridoxal-phosphate dependent enzyme [Paraburkholderia dipogonis]TFE36569.1 pyridoxal-phosphate dependent enzyme [Paraburkholderia dipogonis]